MFADYYAILGISSNATIVQIKAAYKAQSKKWHPDVNPNKDTTKQMQAINEAYLILSDSDARIRYDLEYSKYIKFRRDKNVVPDDNFSNSTSSEYNIQDDVLSKWIQNAKQQARQMMSDTIELAAVGGKAAFESIKRLAVISAVLAVAALLFTTIMNNIESSKPPIVSNNSYGTVQPTTGQQMPIPPLDTVYETVAPSTQPPQNKALTPSQQRINGYLQEILTGKTSTYITSNNPKSRGIDLSMKYPSSWMEKEGNRPHVLVKMREWAHSEMVMLLIFPLDEQGGLAEKSIDRDMLQEFADGSGAKKILGIQSNINIDGISSGIVDLYTESNQLDGMVGMYTRSYIMIYNNSIIQIQCGVTDKLADKSNQELADSFENSLILFKAIVNSVVIKNQWER